MASDSEATEAADHTRHDVRKIWKTSDLLLGYSGNLSVKQPLALALEESLRKAGTGLKRWDARAVICRAAEPVLESAYRAFVPTDERETARQFLGGTLLVMGYDTDGYWLLELDPNNTPSFCERGFHAIGSGSAPAQVANGVMAHYHDGSLTTAHLQLVAYRTVDTCIKTLGGRYGVGGEVHLWTSEERAEFTEVTGDALQAVAHGVEQWATIERESLKGVPGPPANAEALEGEPPPVAIESEPTEQSGS